jgi:hypothetical protein
MLKLSAADNGNAYSHNPEIYTVRIAPRATTTRLFFLYESHRAVRVPQIAVKGFPVEVKISGKVRAPRTAKGTY